MFAFGKDEVLFSFNDLVPLAILTGFITDLKVTYKYRKTCFGFSNWIINLGAVQKSISSRIAEFGRYGGRGFITNPLSVTELNLTMFSIIFYKVSSLGNVKQRQKRPKKRFSLSTVEGF